MDDTKKTEQDVIIRNYIKENEESVIITFNNGMDDFIESSLVNIEIKKGCVFFKNGNSDDHRIAKESHTITITRKDIVNSLRNMNGCYPMQLDEKNNPYICIMQKISPNWATEKPIEINTEKKPEKQTKPQKETVNNQITNKPKTEEKINQNTNKKETTTMPENKERSDKNALNTAVISIIELAKSQINEKEYDKAITTLDIAETLMKG